MAPIWMVIHKFGTTPVLIDSEHPLAVAQRALPASPENDTGAGTVEPGATSAPTAARKRKGG